MPRRKLSTIDMLKSQDLRATSPSIKTWTHNFFNRRNTSKRSSTTLETETDKTPKKSISSIIKTNSRVRKAQIWLPKQEHLSTIYPNNLQGSMIWISLSILRPLIWKTRRPNLSTVKVKLFSLRTKWSASKTSSTISRVLRKNIEMKILIFRRELTQSPPEISNWRMLSRSLRSRFVQRKIKSCTWERNLKVPDTATRPSWTIIPTFR